MLKQRIISTIVLVVAIGLIGYVILTTQTTKTGAEKGMMAPDFTLPMWHTNEEKSLSSFRGEVVVLNLWASWCPPCKKEMPDFVRLSQDYQGKGVTVLGVNLSTHERDEGGVAKFMEEFNVTFPTFVDQPIDSVNRRGIVSTLYNIQSIPNTYILDSKGKIVHVIQGYVTYEILEELIEELL